MAAEGMPAAAAVGAPHSVNGAATVWPRKATRVRSTTPPATGVNGAATVWPRKVRSACSCLASPLPRQWGRDRLAAEGGFPCMRGLSRQKRQWGRDRLAAEG